MGRSSVEVEQPAARTADEVAVRLDGVRKRFGDVAAVDGIDLEIMAGEVFSLLRPSGSGETTCLRMIAGFEAPTQGRGPPDGRGGTRLAPHQRDRDTRFQDHAPV